jgi:lysozyme family protein
MKSNFEPCLAMLLKHEGGFVNHPKDPGGMTNLGVTRAVYEQFVGRQVGEAEMRALTPAVVAPLYKANYWDKGNCDNLPSGVDWFVFDWGVNAGMSRPSKALQRIVGAVPDGMVGPQTLKAIQATDTKQILEALYGARQSFYEGLRTFPTFGKGWTRRNKETLAQSMKLLTNK